MVTPDLPAPPTSGGRVRTFHLLRELGRRHTVDVLAPELSEPEALDASREICRRLWLYEPVTEGLLSRWHRQARSLLTGRLHHPQTRVREMLARATRAESYDVLHFVTPYLFPYLPSEVHPPSLVDFFGTSVGIRRELRTCSGLVSRSKTRLRYRLALRGERRALRNADGALAISETDREFLQRLLPGARIEVVPNGVDTDYFAPQDVPETLGRLAFVGDMSFRPNVEGALFLVREILPRLLGEDSRIRLFLVGRDPAAEVLALAEHEAVRVTGSVPDVRPYMAGAGVVVVPLLGGSGVRNKTLEAMAMGRAVVSTSMGVEGLDVARGSDVSVADDPEDFARAVLELLASRDRRTGMGNNARACVCVCVCASALRLGDERPKGRGVLRGAHARGSSSGRLDAITLVPRAMKGVPSVSVVVPVLDAARTLPGCLEALDALDPVPHEILLVDNGSKDGSRELLTDFAERHTGHRVRVIDEARRGAAAARNAGIRLAAGEIIAFTDSDCSPAKDWLREVTNPFSDASVAAVAGRVVASPAASTLELFSALYTLRLPETPSRHRR